MTVMRFCSDAGAGATATLTGAVDVRPGPRHAGAPYTVTQSGQVP